MKKKKKNNASKVRLSHAGENTNQQHLVYNNRCEVVVYYSVFFKLEDLAASRHPSVPHCKEEKKTINKQKCLPGIFGGGILGRVERPSWPREVEMPRLTWPNPKHKKKKKSASQQVAGSAVRVHKGGW